jgi:hypothetical protein
LGDIGAVVVIATRERGSQDKHRMSFFLFFLFERLLSRSFKPKDILHLHRLTFFSEVIG